MTKWNRYSGMIYFNSSPTTRDVVCLDILNFRCTNVTHNSLIELFARVVYY